MKSITACSLALGTILLVLPCFQANLISSTSTWSRKISNSLQSELVNNPTADIIVSTKVGTSSVLKNFNTPLKSGAESRNVRITSLVSQLQQNARESQKGIIDFLAKNPRSASFSVQSLWISNQIVVKNADHELISSLAQLDDVGQIDLNEIIKLVQPIESKTAAAPQATSWGINNIRAPEVWKESTAGEGIIVATIDSGVRYTHEALRDNYIGEYGWFDPYNQTSLPVDQGGHGTHVTGTIVGKGGIGVAPNATWMACKGCYGDTCTYDALMACGQFVTCPTRWDGQMPNCTKAPHIVSNSWGGSGGQGFYDSVIRAWHTAGIIPVFANGNEGPGCRTAGSPGDNADVIAVGATTDNNGLASFSSRGPSVFGTVKPDISAPGTNINSAGHNSDTSYVVKQGTSMACPHVAGVIALLKSANPDISYGDIKSALFNGAERNLVNEGGECGGISNTNFPNNGYGHGKLDAVNTMLRLESAGNILQFPVLLSAGLLVILRTFSSVL